MTKCTEAMVADKMWPKFAPSMDKIEEETENKKGTSACDEGRADHFADGKLDCVADAHVDRIVDGKAGTEAGKGGDGAGLTEGRRSCRGCDLRACESVWRHRYGAC